MLRLIDGANRFFLILILIVLTLLSNFYSFLEYHHPHLYITHFASIEICEISTDVKFDIR